MLRKVNLVSRKDGSDLYRCEKCGYEVTRKGFGAFKKECPKGCDGDSNEVKGYWVGSREGVRNCVCSCGSEMMIVPKEGHPNSSYWRLRRNREEVLVCCRRGCKAHVRRFPR